MHRVLKPKKRSTNMEWPRTVKMTVKVDQMLIKFIISKLKVFITLQLKHFIQFIYVNVLLEAHGKSKVALLFVTLS